jgi:hypothetical protein
LEGQQPRVVFTFESEVYPTVYFTARTARWMTTRRATWSNDERAGHLRPRTSAVVAPAPAAPPSRLQH